MKHDDFSGKTIVPFCSISDRRFGQTISAIAKLTPKSVILKGIDVTYSSYGRTAIRSWLEVISLHQQTSGIRQTKKDAQQTYGLYSLNGTRLKAMQRVSKSWMDERLSRSSNDFHYIGRRK